MIVRFVVIVAVVALLTLLVMFVRTIEQRVAAEVGEDAGAGRRGAGEQFKPFESGQELVGSLHRSHRVGAGRPDADLEKVEDTDCHD